MCYFHLTPIDQVCPIIYRASVLKKKKKRFKLGSIKNGANASLVSVSILGKNCTIFFAPKHFIYIIVTRRRFGDGPNFGKLAETYSRQDLVRDFHGNVAARNRIDGAHTHTSTDVFDDGNRTLHVSSIIFTNISPTPFHCRPPVASTRPFQFGAQLVPPFPNLGQQGLRALQLTLQRGHFPDVRVVLAHVPPHVTVRITCQVVRVKYRQKLVGRDDLRQKGVADFVRGEGDT